MTATGCGRLTPRSKGFGGFRALSGRQTEQEITALHGRDRSQKWNFVARL
jgi:hypothetical protein